MPARIKQFFCAVLLAACLTQGALAAEDDPAKWEKDIQAFEQADRTNPPPKEAVLFVGSSSIRFWTNLASAFPEVKTIRRGFGGSRIPDVTHYVDRIVLPYKPAKVVLYAGDNDIARGSSAEQVRKDFEGFVAKIHSELPKTEIIFIAIKPSPSRWHLAEQGSKANDLVRAVAAAHPRVTFVDIWTPMLGEDGKPRAELFTADNLHINEQGYALWTRLLKPHVVSR